MRKTGVLLSGLLAATAAAQYTERIEVRLHQLDVIVVTRDGRPVTDLTQDDFVVLMNRKPQTITNFSKYVELATASSEAGASTAAEQPRERRRVIFFLDEVTLYPPSRDFLLKRVAELLDTMRPGDEAMIVTPASVEEKIPLYMTGNRELIMRTLARITRDMMLRFDITPIESQWEPQIGKVDIGYVEKETVRRVDDCGMSLEVCSKRRLTTLKSILATASELPGKKVLVLLTTRMSTIPGMILSNTSAANAPAANSIADRRRQAIVNEFKTLEPLVKEVGREAAAANVTIYGIEPFERGKASLPGVTAERKELTGPRMDRDSENGTWDTLRSLAEQTGGAAFRGADEIPRLLDRIDEDLSTYYSLAFRDAAGKETDYHNVEVRIRNRRDVVVRTRRTVSTKAPDEESAAEVTAALLTSDPPNPLGIGVSVAPLVREGATVAVPLKIAVPIGKLTFTRDGDKQRATFQVRVGAVGQRAEFRAAGEQRQEVVIPAADFAAAQKSTFTYDMNLHLPPGSYRVAVRVADVLSNERGLRTLEVRAQ
jgi:VWFA-related protein